MVPSLSFNIDVAFGFGFLKCSHVIRAASVIQSDTVSL